MQDRLTGAAVAFGARRASDQFLLKGLLFDDRGFRMTPSSVRKNGRQFRYYLSRALFEGAKDQAGSLPRVSAPVIEDAVTQALEAAAAEQGGRDTSREEGSLIRARVEKIIISRKTITIDLTAEGAEALDRQQIVTAWNPRSTAVRRDALSPENIQATSMRSDRRAAILLAIAKGRAWLNDLTRGSIASVEDLAARESRTVRSITMGLSLAFLAPDLVQAAVDGVLPKGLSVSRLFDLPADWARQRTTLGLPAAAKT